MLKEQVREIINTLAAHPYGVRFSVILASVNTDKGQLLTLLPHLEKQQVVFRKVVNGTVLYFLRRGN